MFQILFCFLPLLCSDAYNVGQTGDAVNYILSPYQRSLIVERQPSASGRSFNTNPQTAGPSLTNRTSYFGYQLQLSKESPGFRAVIGAPKTTNFTNPRFQSPSKGTPASGDILSCPVVFPFSRLNQPICTSVAPPEAGPGDGFGLSVKASPRGRLSACSPTKEQNCAIVKYSPGFCYNKERYSNRWVQDAKTRENSCPDYNLDLMFVLDGSGSVGQEQFTKVKSWVKQVAGSFEIDNNSTRIGVVQYSHFNPKKDVTQQKYITTEVGLGHHRDKAGLFRAIDNITLHGYTTYTAHALNYTAGVFNASARQGNTSKVLILLTDGRSNDRDKLSDSANYVRSLGITTLAVGVGGAEPDELQTIATGTNSNKNVYYVSNFEQLEQIVNGLKTDIITIALEGSTNASTVALLLHHAQTGFSIHPSIKRVWQVW